MDILSGLGSGKYRLGKLCKHGHSWDSTGQSARVVRKNGQLADCVECRNERCRKYYADNRESFLSDCRRRYFENHERNLEYRKEWYQAVRQDPSRYARFLESSKKQHRKNRQREREYAREWYRRNPEKAKAKHDRWRKAHPEADAARLRRNGLIRKARKKAAHSVSIPQSVFDSKIELFSGKCAYCLTVLDIVTWDHFIPLAAGGSHVESNLVPCCGKCNSSKCDLDAIVWFRSKPFWSKRQESVVLKHLGKTLENYNQVPLL